MQSEIAALVAALHRMGGYATMTQIVGSLGRDLAHAVVQGADKGGLVKLAQCDRPTDEDRSDGVLRTNSQGDVITYALVLAL